MNRRSLFLNCVSVITLSLTLCGFASADVVTLYDDGLGNLPSAQPWLNFFAAGGVASQTATASGTRLQSDLGASVGYSNHAANSLPFLPQFINPNFPSLSDTDGYSLSFQLQVFDESHSNNDRAGFSVIVLGDNGRGIELGFWDDRVFAQNAMPLFTHGEEAFFNTAAGEAQYVLSIQNDGYALSADTQTILSGGLRDYSAFTVTPFGIPYSLKNFVFLGDNTTSAAADVSIGSIVLNSSLATVPEPSALAIVGILFAAAGCRRKRLASSPSKTRWHAPHPPTEDTGSCLQYRSRNIRRQSSWDLSNSHWKSNAGILVLTNND